MSLSEFNLIFYPIPIYISNHNSYSSNSLNSMIIKNYLTNKNKLKKNPICTSVGEKVTFNRKIGKKHKLIGYGTKRL